MCVNVNNQSYCVEHRVLLWLVWVKRIELNQGRKFYSFEKSKLKLKFKVLIKINTNIFLFWMNSVFLFSFCTLSIFFSFKPFFQFSDFWPSFCVCGRVSILDKFGHRSFMGYHHHQPTRKKRGFWLSYDGQHWRMNACNILIYIKVGKNVPQQQGILLSDWLVGR